MTQTSNFNSNANSTLRICIFYLISCFSFGCHAEIETQSAFTSSQLFQNAIKAGEMQDVVTLIKSGLDVNEAFSDGITPLHVAVINNQEQIATLLIENGAKVNVVDTSTSATPLHLAALYGREEIAKLLVQKGADINASMRFGITPLMVAAQFKQTPLIQLLLDKKANINYADQEGYTALHFAAENGDATIAQMLLTHGANVHLKDKTNQATPLAVATESNHPDVAKLILENTK